MNTKLQQQYKADTGNSCFQFIESSHLTRSMSGVEFDGMTAKEIKSHLDYDVSKNAKWGLFVDQLPDEYQMNEDIFLITPQYVEWLEEKVIELTRHKL